MELIKVEAELDSMGYVWNIFTWTENINGVDVQYAAQPCSLGFIETVNIIRLMQRIQDAFDRRRAEWN